MTVSARDIIAYLCIQEEGDWDRIFQRIEMRDFPNPERIREVLDKLDCKYVTAADPEYPAQLRQIYKAPYCLFYYGDISLLDDHQNQIISIIGSRDYSEYGEMATRSLSTNLARDFVVVSGLARGIDAIAAESVLSANGKTVAVLGSGVNICYPQENLELYQMIKKHGLLISEYPCDVQPSQDKFPMRNRIIAGLSRGILVTEAGIRSGTSITVNLGLMSGKDIMCIPYPFGSSSTCNRLIKEGAFLVENADDVRRYIGKY